MIYGVNVHGVILQRVNVREVNDLRYESRVPRSRPILARPFSYRQMAGRSGRSRSDAYGEVILVANNSVPLARLRELAQAEPAPVASCLGAQSRGMRRAMLEVVAAGAVRSARDVQLYCGSTLLAATVAGDVVRDSTIEALKWLGRHGFVVWDAAAAQYQPTVFGKAAFACGLLPELCLSLLVRRNPSGGNAAA